MGFRPNESWKWVSITVLISHLLLKNAYFFGLEYYCVTKWQPYIVFDIDIYMSDEWQSIIRFYCQSNSSLFIPIDVLLEDITHDSI